MTTSARYPGLQKPGYIGSVRIKNRLVRTGSNQGFPPEPGDGYLQSYYKDFYEGMASGGVGMVTIGASPVGTPPAEKGYRLDDDKYIPGLREFTDRMHRHDCPVFLQTFHIGPWLPGELSAAASTLSEEEMPITTQSIPNAHALTKDEIIGIVKEFGDRMERAYRAGFDGVEVNAGCTHLFSTFMSRMWNKRKDEYGSQSLENRARIVVEVIKEIRARAGDDFAIAVLFNPVEPGIKDGIAAEEGIEFAKIFEDAGVDAIIPRVEYYVNHKFDGKNDSSHFPDVILYPDPPETAEESGIEYRKYGTCGWVPLQTAIKKAVNVPVIGVGRMSPDCSEKLIENNELDFISMTRNLIADHDYPNKLFEGRFEDIAPCTFCMTCFDLNEEGLPVTCRINPSAFREAEYEIVPAAVQKNVVVAGGGPAGMEAARVAALRGHKVTLVEKENILGGAMNPYSVILGECKEDVQCMINYFKTQLDKLNVDIRLGTGADKSTIEEYKPDAVVLAVGGKHNIPDIPGVSNDNVLTSRRLYTGLTAYFQASNGKPMQGLDRNYVPVGSSIVIIGGDYQGVKTAIFFRSRGCSVSIVESGPEIGANLLKHLVAPQVLDWLYRRDVSMFTDAELKEITCKGVVISDKNGNIREIEADTVITSLPFLPDESLFTTLKDTAPEIYNIGNSKSPGRIVDAVADGSRIGREI